jgi:hypothetical protein
MTTDAPLPAQRPWCDLKGTPLDISPRWGLYPLDWHSHAIDTFADHPLGEWIARCGDRLLAATELYDHPPGHRCVSCARWMR